MPLFCRHNRFEQNCPICSREKEAERRPSRPARASTPRRAGAPAAPARPQRLVTRKLAQRAADDGYRNDLVPGVKATEDAERLAACLALAAQRLEFPGPYPELAEETDVETATRRAFVLTVGEESEALIGAYDAWAERHGAQKAIGGEPGWTPERRFARAYERLSLPGITRAQRFDFLAVLGAAGTYDLQADALHPAGTDPATVAAKRALVSGETMLLERRAKALAEATGVPVGALDRGLATWDSAEPVEAPDGALHEQVRTALGV